MLGEKMSNEDVNNIIRISLTSKALEALNPLVIDRILIEVLYRPRLEDIIRIEVLPKAFGGEKICPNCGKSPTLLKVLKKYYCFNCKKYV